MPVTHTEGLYLGDIVKFEEDGRYSRKNVVILAGAGAARELVRGQVLGKNSATGKYEALNPVATDGTENAAGILLYDATAPDGVDVEGVALVRHATVMASQLVWPDGATEEQKTAALAQLDALGVIAAKEA